MSNPELQGSVIIASAGIDPNGGLAAVLAERADILGLSEASHDAALRPADPGGISHGLRAALACRMARIGAATDLADHYSALLDSAADRDALQSICEPDSSPDDPKLHAIITHCDRVSKSPRDAGPGDIAALAAAGVSEADIVRLSGLIAFLSYQVRVVTGLKLMDHAP